MQARGAFAADGIAAHDAASIDGSFLSEESTPRIDTVIFDKTGTLTSAIAAVVNVTATRGCDAANVLRVAALPEVGSAHRLATASVAAAGNNWSFTARYRGYSRELCVGVVKCIAANHLARRGSVANPVFHYLDRADKRVRMELKCGFEISITA